MRVAVSYEQSTPVAETDADKDSRQATLPFKDKVREAARLLRIKQDARLSCKTVGRQ